LKGFLKLKVNQLQSTEAGDY